MTNRIFKPGLVLLMLGALVGSLLNSAPVLAEPIPGLIAYTEIADNGRFIIGSYTGPFITIWDTERLWDYLQPTQVHAFKGSATVSTGAMPVAAAQKAPYMAYVDSDPAAVHVCPLETGFACQPPILLNGRLLSLALSPDGRQLVVLTATELLRAEFGDETQLLRQNHPGWRFLKADWVRKRAIIWERDGRLSALDLGDLTTKAVVGATTGAPQAGYLTADGQHLVVSQNSRNSDTGVFERETRLYPLAAQDNGGSPPVVVKTADDIIPGDSPEKLWYVSARSEDEWALTPVGPAGEPLSADTLALKLVTGSDTQIIAVSERRGYILIRDGYSSHYLVDLETRLPTFEIYSSNVRYWHFDDELPHLTPKLGAAPLYKMRLRLSHDLSWEADSGYYFSNQRAKTLLQTAALMTRLRERYDPVWFLLLAELGRRPDPDGSYLRLSELTMTLVQLNRAEYLLRSENAEAALECSREALRAVRRYRQELNASPPPDDQALTVQRLVADYWPVLERDLWLVLAQSLAASERDWEAELAYRKVLEDQPQEWRAYNGLLRLYLPADDATFAALVTETQAALQMRGWTDRPVLGFPSQFFDEEVLQRLRSAQADTR